MRWLIHLSVAVGALCSTPTFAAPPGELDMRHQEVVEVPFDGGFIEHLDVRMFTVDVHVFDRKGSAVRNLDSDDFRLKIDGELVPIEAVEWVEPPAIDSVVAAPADVKTVDARDLPATQPPPLIGRQSLIIVAHNDFDVSRLIGHIRTIPKVQAMLEKLPAYYDVALLSFDTRLKLRLDLTRDHQSVIDALPRSIRRDIPPFPIAASDASRPSLARYIDADQARDASKPETALHLIGKAAEQIPGDTSILWLGYGLDRGPIFDEARKTLMRARVPFLALNVTDAEFNSLEGGLIRMARLTGGTYQRTNLWPALAVGKVERLFYGHYVLFIPWQHLTPGDHALDVRLAPGRRGQIRASAAVIEATALPRFRESTR